VLVFGVGIGMISVQKQFPGVFGRAGNAVLFKIFPCLRQGKEDFSVKEFIAQLAIEGFDIAIFGRLSRPDKVEVDTFSVSPGIPFRRTLGHYPIALGNPPACFAASFSTLITLPAPMD